MITARIEFSFQENCAFKSPVKGPSYKNPASFSFAFSSGIFCPHLEVTCAQLRVLPSRFGIQVPEADEGPPVLRSSCHFSRLRRRAFMKKLLTVVSSRPSCWEMVICISLDGRLFSLKMAKSVRRWRSVNTRRDFFWELVLSLFGSCSLRLHA